MNPECQQCQTCGAEAWLSWWPPIGWVCAECGRAWDAFEFGLNVERRNGKQARHFPEPDAA
jgi:hypothetical protein